MRLLPFLGPAILALPLATAADRPQWGEAQTRNMVSPETGLPTTFDPVTGANLRWSVPLGSENYGTPVIGCGVVLIGANNDPPRDPRFSGDRGILLCLDERDGHRRWQLPLTKRGPTPYWDWYRCGICSSATIVGDRAYILTNRTEMVCLDLKGQADGNDGWQGESRLFADRGGGAVELQPGDADILWICDLTAEAQVRTHDAAVASVLVVGDRLYVNTCNGLDDRHAAMGNPDAPSLVVLDRATGRIVARERERIGTDTFHCTWSSPTLALAGGRPLVVFGGGDGICYGFEPFTGLADATTPAALACRWRCDTDPDAPKRIRALARNRREGPSTIIGTPVVVDGRIYVAATGDTWWGKRSSQLVCIDASGSGDVTATHRRWSHPLTSHCMSTPAVHDGLVFIGDCGGIIHCIDAASGAGVWTHDAGGEIWASPLVADGKLYLGTRRGTLWVLAAGRDKAVLGEVHLGKPIDASVNAANGTLYVATHTTLYAVGTR